MSTRTGFQIRSAYDGLDIDCLGIVPDGEIKAVVQLAHGMSEYKERYVPFMEYLADCGYACYINDHRGHGKSIKAEEDLGFFYTGGGNALVEDMKLLTDLIKEKHPGKKFFLFGHSMGSLAVRVYAKRYDDELDGLIVCGCPSDNPALGVGSRLVNMLIKMKGERYRSDLCKNIFVAAFNKNFKKEGSDFAWLSVNKENVERYEKDPLCGFNFTLNGYRSLIYLMKETYDLKGWKMSKPQLPVQFMSGEYDPCMTNEKCLLQAVASMSEVGYDNTSYVLFENMRHEVLLETDNMKVFEFVRDTLDGWLG